MCLRFLQRLVAIFCEIASSLRHHFLSKMRKLTKMKSTPCYQLASHLNCKNIMLFLSVMIWDWRVSVSASLCLSIASTLGLLLWCLPSFDECGGLRQILEVF